MTETRIDHDRLCQGREYTCTCGYDADIDAELSRRHERILELQMHAWKWMEAHDCLKSGRPYSFPSPADMPEALAEIKRLRSALSESLDVHAGLADFIISGRGPIAGKAKTNLYVELQRARREAGLALNGGSDA